METLITLWISAWLWAWTAGVTAGIVVPELLKPRRFGRIFGLTERTVREWIAARKIEVVKVGGSVRIPATEVERLIREGRRPATRSQPGAMSDRTRLEGEVGTPH